MRKSYKGQLIPDRLLVIDIINHVVFPSELIERLSVDYGTGELLNQEFADRTAKKKKCFLAAITVKKINSQQIYQPEDFYDVGTVAVLEGVDYYEDEWHLKLNGLYRFKVVKITQKDGYNYVKVKYLPDDFNSEGDCSDLISALLMTNREIWELVREREGYKHLYINDSIEEEKNPHQFINLLYPLFNKAKLTEKIRLLSETDGRARLEFAHAVLHDLKKAFALQIMIEKKVSHQYENGARDAFLRTKINEMRKILGEADTVEKAVKEYGAQLEALGLPISQELSIKAEISRLQNMAEATQEFSILCNYLDFVFSLPWNNSVEICSDMDLVRSKLAASHYGLDEIKKRIFEYVAVRLRNPNARGVVLCLVGPPGTGKTSLAQAIAEATGLPFTRLSLGGIKDESDIRGHRKTYIGSMPGKIIQAIRRIGVKNPVFCLDEIDKMGQDFRGDPAAALLEVLDPEQNLAFEDHYVNLPFDLSRVIFVATANTEENIPPALRDRMEVIKLRSYTSLEKEQIARRFLFPRQIRLNHLGKRELRISLAVIRRLAENYTHESGVRKLEQLIARLCRIAVTGEFCDRSGTTSVTVSNLSVLLGQARAEIKMAPRRNLAGTMIGLDYTSDGSGDILDIEWRKMPGKGDLMLTGQLGAVMKESATIAFSLVRSNGLLAEAQVPFYSNDYHLHVPEGAIEKDGPSAGVAIALAFYSLIKGEAIKPKLAVTGEITLVGKVLAVGGIKEKVIAAHRSGIREVILPDENWRQDLEQIPAEVRNAMTFHPIKSFKDALRIAFT